MKAKDIMSTPLISARRDTPLKAIAQLLVENLHLRGFPVMAEDQVVGWISRRDIVRVLARTDQCIETELQERLAEESGVIGTFTGRVQDGDVILDGPADKRLIVSQTEPTEARLHARTA